MLAPSMTKTPCTYCNEEFTPSRYHPTQRVCGSEKCQRRRRADYHRNKLATDPGYREQCRDSQKKWRQRNPGYMKRYRTKQRVLFRHNPDKPRLLKALHQLSLSVKNSFVLDLRSLDAGIWLISDGVSSGKNILASAKIIILQAKLSDLAGRNLKRTSL